jgi:hypothetical protein
MQRKVQKIPRAARANATPEHITMIRGMLHDD